MGEVVQIATADVREMKILNLYAGLGGNRYLWENCEVTAIENNKDIAEAYSKRFPRDQVIITNAHEYLLNNFKKFDFIWSSPPCPSHSSFRQNINVRFRGSKAKYPDMSLYQEIIFLQHNFYQKQWCVENVIPYYQPLIEPRIKLGRHLFWSNFKIIPKTFQSKIKIRKSQINELSDKHKIKVNDLKLSNKRQVLRNCVDSEIGLYILQSAIAPKVSQLPLFKYESA